MKRNLLYIGLIPALFGCFFGEREVRVRSVAFSETIILRSRQENPHQIKIRGEGRIEGVASITLILNGDAYKTEELNGDVHFVWMGDWYDSQAVVEYDHGNAKSGNLIIIYDF
ncbi:MAG: hypothetical protein KAR05_05765 [Candidatus Omnitrophica bacterium]|nr:hypothetical protein [Candidatus Omnitrophota bacterium]